RLVRRTPLDGLLGFGSLLIKLGQECLSKFNGPLLILDEPMSRRGSSHVCAERRLSPPAIESNGGRQNRHFGSYDILRTDSVRNNNSRNEIANRIGPRKMVLLMCAGDVSEIAQVAIVVSGQALLVRGRAFTAARGDRADAPAGCRPAEEPGIPDTIHGGHWWRLPTGSGRDPAPALARRRRSSGGGGWAENCRERYGSGDRGGIASSAVKARAGSAGAIARSGCSAALVHRSVDHSGP